ncbi:DNL-type zinc finger protein [Araneus ventricosus]|uniref:DNL-type zinc finger protein n=1 Tax=Araneus ventricosus TaxID=182803 RepID=A0A4Y2RK27_ARAVE|nr:DNL-type zinc finger protein [Araneus ventricosus]
MLQKRHDKIQYSKFMKINSRWCSHTAYEHTPESSKTSGSIGKITPKLFLAFTCKVCKARVEKHISKIAYTKGVVIVRCDGCEENHLIADNLGWFPNLKAMRNVEDFMEAQGETVKKTADAIKKEE